MSTIFLVAFSSYMQSRKSTGDKLLCNGGIRVRLDDILVKKKDIKARTEAFLTEGADKENIARNTFQTIDEEAIQERKEAAEFNASNGESRVSAVLPQTPDTDNVNWPGPMSRTCINPADAQIAVSRSHVVVTTNDTFAFYLKNGDLLRSFYPDDFFIRGPNFDSSPLNISHYMDVRAIFDPYSNRFLLGLLVFSKTGDQFNNSKFVLAVSTSEDPIQDWYFFWWDAVAHDGVANDPVFQYGDNGDYPSLGIDNSFIYQTNSVDNFDANGLRYHRY
jgi:hypothetical protein